MLQWSLGWTGSFDPISPPSISMARLAITSLAFMLDWVPDPVCQTTSGKVVVELAVDDLLRGLDDGVGQPHVQLAAFLVGLGAGALDHAERADDGQGLFLPADGEVQDRPLRLRAPVLVGWHLEGAEAVGFGSGGCHGRPSGMLLHAV